MLFADIPGHKESKSILTNAVKNNHSAHALLFLGKTGSSNLSLALAYATYLNCEERGDDDSCGSCPSCFKMKKFIHPDFHFLMPTAGKIDGDAEQAKLLVDWRQFLTHQPYGDHSDWAQSIDAENKQLGIKIDEARKLVSNLTLKAFEGPYKIALIWLPEFMNNAAANMLLKTLEEPSEKTIFLLVCNDIEKVIITIQSRCQPIYVRDFNDEEIVFHLTNTLKTPQNVAQKAAYIANGNMMEAINHTKSSNESENHLLLFRDWMRLCFNYQNNFRDIISLSDKLQGLGREEQKNFLNSSITYFNEAILKKFTGEDLVRLKENELEFITNFSKVVNENNIEPIVNALTDAHYHIERNAIGSLTFLDLSIKIGQLIKI